MSESQEKWYVVETDNFGSETPNEQWVPIPPMTRAVMKTIADAYNETYGGEQADRFWKVVPDGYELVGGIGKEVMGETQEYSGPVAAGRWYVRGTTARDAEGNVLGQRVYLGRVIGGDDEDDNRVFQSSLRLGDVEDAERLKEGIEDLLAEQSTPPTPKTAE